MLFSNGSIISNSGGAHAPLLGGLFLPRFVMFGVSPPAADVPSGAPCAWVTVPAEWFGLVSSWTYRFHCLTVYAHVLLLDFCVTSEKDLDSTPEHVLGFRL